LKFKKTVLLLILNVRLETWKPSEENTGKIPEDIGLQFLGK
jgi:hypothetical protein